MHQHYFGENAVSLANLCRLYLLRQKYSMFDSDETPLKIIGMASSENLYRDRQFWKLELLKVKVYVKYPKNSST